MSNFHKAFEKLMKLEFKDHTNFLHKNRGENDYTVGGIYRTANPHWYGWKIVMIELQANNFDIFETSSKLFNNKHFMSGIAQFFKENEWDRMKLDRIKNQNTAEEIFLFGVNSGKRNAIRKAQRLVGVYPDGLIGPITIKALNDYDPTLFDMQFDEIEKQFYADIIERKPSFAIFQNGWINRAEFV